MVKKRTSSRKVTRHITQPKVFDVHRPGSSPAPATSRPIITGRSLLTQDSAAAVSGVGERAPTLNNQRHKIIVNPPAMGQNDDVRADGLENVPSDGTANGPATGPISGPKDSVSVRVFKKSKSIEPLGNDNAVALAAAAIDGSNQKPASPPSPSSRTITVSSKNSDDGPLMITSKHQETVVAPPAPSAVPAPGKVEPPAKEAPKEAPVETKPALGPELVATPPKESETEDIQDFTVVRYTSHGHGWKVVVLLLLVLILAVAIVDILLDTSVVEWQGIPHTNFLAGY